MCIRDRLGGGVGALLVGFALARSRSIEGVLGGVGIGALVAAAWWVSGSMGHLMEHPVTLDEVFIATNTQRMESFTFVAPIAYTVDWLILFSDANKRLTIGIVKMCIRDRCWPTSAAPTAHRRGRLTGGSWC